MYMRFGILPFDITLVAEKVISILSFGKGELSSIPFIEKVVSKGFKHIELSLDVLQVFPMLLDERSLKWISHKVKDRVFTVTAHLPLWGLEPSWINERIRKASIETIIDSIKTIENFLHPEYYVFHIAGKQVSEFTMLSYKYSFIKNALKIFSKIAVKSIFEIIDETDIDKRRIACETIEFPYDLTLNVINETGTSFLIDTGHVLSGQCGEMNLYKMIEENVDKIVGFHIHDGYIRKDGKGNVIWRDHLPLGEGDLDVIRFFNLLKEIGFNGPLVFELSLEDALKSLKYVKKVYGEIP